MPLGLTLKLTACSGGPGRSAFPGLHISEAAGKPRSWTRPMQTPIKFPHPQQLRAPIMMAACLSACTHWQVQSVSPQQVLETRHPQKIRVTRADSTKVVLAEPRIVGDTLYGVGARSPRAAHQPPGEGIALADVSQVAIRRTDPAATTLLVLGSAAVVGGVALVVFVSSLPED